MSDGASRLYLKNILSSLSSSFTDVKNAISGVSTKVDSVSTKVDSVSTKVGQTTSELSKLAKTVNKNSGYIAKGLKQGSTSIPTSALTTVLSVSGSGVLYNAFIVQGVSSNFYLLVTIDGVAYKIKYRGAGSTQTNILYGIVAENMFMFEGASMKYMFDGISLLPPSTSLRPFSELEKAKEGLYTYITFDGIPFSKSLKIEVYYGNGNNPIVWAYALD